MFSPVLQIIIPFFLSAIVVIIITVIAEKYGTKAGGILGTLPSTIVIAFLFIGITKGETFASKAAVVVPAELGINVIFLFVFALLIHRSTLLAFVGTFSIWAILSTGLVLINLEDIFISLGCYIAAVIFSFLIMEKSKKIRSSGKRHIHYTAKKIMFRGVLAGIVIAIAVFLSNFGSVISGIFSVFPAILSSTMLISVKEHGPDFASGMAKSMLLGLSSVATYATIIHFIYPIYGLIIGSALAYAASFCVTIFIFILRRRII